MTYEDVKGAFKHYPKPRLSMKLLWKLALKLQTEKGDTSANVFLKFVEREMKSPNKGV